jgi:hypothetical protein
VPVSDAEYSDAIRIAGETITVVTGTLWTEGLERHLATVRGNLFTR